MTVLFNIFMRQTLTDYFGGLHKNMNCAFPLRTSFYRIPPDDSFYSIVCIYHPPRSKTPPPFFLPSPLLKSANCSSTPFLGNPPPTMFVFREPLSPSLKVIVFSELPKCLSFSSLIPSYLLKVTKFWDQISHSEFLNSLLINFFCH